MGLPNLSKPEGDRQSWIQEESLALGRWLLEAELLVTHQDADLDALFSLVLAQLFRTTLGKAELPVAFVPGSVREFKKKVVGLDIGTARGLRSAGQGVMLKASGAGGSSCMALLRLLDEEEYDILKTVVSEISKSDEDPRARSTAMRTLDEIAGEVIRLRPHDKELHMEVKSVLNSRRSILFCTSIYDTFQSLRAAGVSDLGLYNFVCEWVNGALTRGRRRKNIRLADSEMPDARRLFNGRLVVLPMGLGVDASKTLEKQGAELTLYCRSIGGNNKHWTLVLHRAPGALINLDELFTDRMEEFEDICIKDFLVGWTAEKGGGLRIGKAEDIQAIRERFIDKVIRILEPWMASPVHE